MAKILLLGIPKAGKSSIYQESYKAITCAEDNPYKTIILKVKSLQKILQIQFREENSFEISSKEKVKEIFTNVQIVLWVVDVANQRTISTSLFHWKQVLKWLNEYSAYTLKYVCFHKIDLLNFEDKDTLFSSLKSDFQSSSQDQVNFHYTSLNDSSALVMMADVMKKIHEASFEIKQAHNKISQFLETNEDFFGATILSSDGLPIIEIGDKVEFVILPANLWLGTNERLREAFNAETLACTIHLNEQTLLFFDIGSDLLLTTITKKEAPLQFSFIRSDLLAQSLREILGVTP
ncbi:MAG: ADP-ribosylation factor-like protein [Candidatus Hodarchaeales archaeon]|jgi:predicted regulator of Ras-like GTPase activity (Roadblock/LC7/MglB family)